MLRGMAVRGRNPGVTQSRRGFPARSKCNFLGGATALCHFCTLTLPIVTVTNRRSRNMTALAMNHPPEGLLELT